MSEVLLGHAVVEENLALEYVQSPNPPEERKEMMRLIINAVTEQVERYCRRPWRSRAFVDLQDGNGTVRMTLRRMPIVSLTSVLRLNRDGTTAAAYTASDFVVSLERGSIEFRSWNVFWRGFENYQISYTAGYAAIPDDVRMAALIAINDAWKDYEQQRDGLESISFEGETKQFNRDVLPKKARQRLDRYRLGAQV